MKIRKVAAGEERELLQLYLTTIRRVNCIDYSPEQVQAWASVDIDLADWERRIRRNNPYVCIHVNPPGENPAEQIVGFADLLENGHIDMFFVHYQWQRQGIAGRLYAAIEEEAVARKLTQLTSDVSITARGFFERRGFQVVAEQEVWLGPTALTNFKMRKRLVNE